MTVTVTLPFQRSAFRRVLGFVRVMYRPHYALYGVLWVLALEGTAALVSDRAEPWRPNWHTAVRVGVVLLVLLYLRMVDEQKDLDYDRVNNPDRPLVTGAVTATDLRVSMVFIAVACAAASFALSVWSGVLLMFTLGYGLFLWAAEAASARVRTHILLNLAITYPVQLILTAFVLVSAADTGDVEPGWRVASTTVVFAGAFLQFEFARKTSKSYESRELLYSNALGPAGSAVTIGVLASTAVVADIALVRPWELAGTDQAVAFLPLLLIPVPWLGVRQFLGTARERFPLGPAVAFVLALYVVLIAIATTVG